MTTRRLVLSRGAALVGAASTGLLLPEIARAQSNRVRVGFMLPYTGTFAQLGVAIENGVRMAIGEKGGKLGGREIEWFKVPKGKFDFLAKFVRPDKIDGKYLSEITGCDPYWNWRPSLPTTQETGE